MRLRLILILGVIGGLLVGNFNLPGSTTAFANPEPTPETPSVIQYSYMPLVFLPGSGQPGQVLNADFGVEVTNGIQTTLMPLVKNSGGTWTRTTVFDWSIIEPTLYSPPQYAWSQVNRGKEAQLAEASANGIEVIATIKYTPTWARKYPGIKCGPMAQAYLDEFASFVQAAVARYSVPPYNIKYWELGNEPDVDALTAIPNEVYGCWGDKSDPYFGGRYYSQMLSAVYPAIKAVDPNAQVVIGGLLLDCDPAKPPAGMTCLSGKFFEGILVNGGGNNFDYVGFHAHAPYTRNAGGPVYPVPIAYDDDYPAWSHLGGVVMGKVNFLRSVMNQYGVNKPLIHDEASLTCPEWSAFCPQIGVNGVAPCPDPNTGLPAAAFFETQADFLVRLFVRNIAANVKSTIWFTLEGPGWRCSGLFYGTSTGPKPAYNALTYMTGKLKYTGYSTQINQYPGVWGYEFKNAVQRIWVLGAPKDVGYTITLPANWVKVTDKYGAPITPNASHQIFVKSPVYVEFPP